MDILKDVSDSPAGSFQRGEVLFQPICRQLLISGEETFAFPWDLLPMPKLLEARPPVTGEFLAVKSSSKAQDDAFKVMLAFLDEDIQRIFARHKFGLPVMKSMIADTLDSRKYRDDLFVTEVNRMAVDNAVNHDLHVACLPPVTDFQSGRIMPAEFCEEVIEIFLEMTQAARRQKKAKQYYSYTGI
jgi:ABC-type glycerol-3-phosphate transport system substrate-binding protein